MFWYLNGVYWEAGEGLLVRSCSDKTGNNVYRLEEWKFIVDISNKFFSVGMARHWHRLPEDAPPRQCSRLGWMGLEQSALGLETDDL